MLPVHDIPRNSSQLSERIRDRWCAITCFIETRVIYSWHFVVRRGWVEEQRWLVKVHRYQIPKAINVTMTHENRCETFILFFFFFFFLSSTRDCEKFAFESMRGIFFFFLLIIRTKRNLKLENSKILMFEADVNLRLWYFTGKYSAKSRNLEIQNFWRMKNDLCSWFSARPRYLESKSTNAAHVKYLRMKSKCASEKG